MNLLFLPNKMCSHTCSFTEPTDYVPACKGNIVTKHPEPASMIRSTTLHLLVLAGILRTYRRCSWLAPSGLEDQY